MTRYYVPEICRFLNLDQLEYLNPEIINGLNLFSYCLNNPVIYSDEDGTTALLAIGILIGLGIAIFTDSKDRKMVNSDVKWYDYLGSALVGGIAAELIGSFASMSFSFSIPTFGIMNTGGALALGITGSIEISITGFQVLTGAARIGLTILMSRTIGKSNGYTVKHNYPNDHLPAHAHVYGDDIHRGSHGIRIGIDGNPLKGEPSLSPSAKKNDKKTIKRNKKSIVSLGREDMRIIKELFKYGFHDTYINSIFLSKNYLDLDFANGVYNLDEFGRETTLTSAVKMRIYIDITLFKLNDVIEIRNVYPQFEEVSTKKIIKSLKKNSLSIDNIFYSNFNNKILIDCGCYDSIYFISIEDCEKIEYIFE